MNGVILSGLIVPLLFISNIISGAQAILPTGAIDVKCQDGSGCDYTLFASQAFFGAWPAMEAQNNEPMIPFLSPSDDPLLCLGSLSSTQLQQQASSKFIFVAPRGECTFEQKAYNAQKLGASGLIIYGTLASRYSLNETTIQDDKPTPADIVYPREFHDYDCTNARAEIPIAALSFSQYPYDAARNDPILSGTADKGNLCAYHHHNFEDNCPSMRCLLTGNKNTDQTTMEACCAWDLHIWLYRDENMTASSDADDGKNANDLVTIPTFYITMAEADTLVNNLQMNKVSVTMYSRYAPEYNISSIIIWALGVFVAALAAWVSAGEYRYAAKYGLLDQEFDDNGDSHPHPRGPNEYERVVSNGSAGAVVNPDESLELGAAHAIGFIFFSAGGLLILFYFKIYSVVKCLYAFGCSGAIFQVIFYPLFYRMTMKMNMRDRIAFRTEILELGPVSYVQLLAALVSYGLGGVWMYISFTRHHPDSILFFWVMQDIMGACMCIMFLSTMKVNSIQVASVLLTAAFFYDIFFVFVTPYITKGGKSIMVDVATSGGPPKADPIWCEKYPDDKDCQGGDPLPMLFTIPRIGDFSGGSSMLGLGDIVLPGLLLSFASRYDEAKRFIGVGSRGGRPESQNCSTQKKGYFPPLVVAYAVGLAMANIAVYAMRMGQPALLYLVPCCLGTMVYLGWKRGELPDLWHTPKVILACDEKLYGPVDDREGETSESTFSVSSTQ